MPIQRGIANALRPAKHRSSVWLYIEKGEHRLIAWSGFCDFGLRKSNPNFLWSTFERVWILEVNAEDGMAAQMAGPPGPSSCEGLGAREVQAR